MQRPTFVANHYIDDYLLTCTNETSCVVLHSYDHRDVVVRNHVMQLCVISDD